MTNHLPKTYFIEAVWPIVVYGIWVMVNKYLVLHFSVDLMVDVVIGGLFLSLMLSRSANTRYYVIGFAWLCLTVLVSLFNSGQYLTGTASITLGLFVLGVLNQVLFEH